MPVSKKKKYVESPFAYTAGYRKNAHRDKYGETQQKRELRSYRRSRRIRMGDIL